VSGRQDAAAEGQAAGRIGAVEALQPAAENLDAGLPTWISVPSISLLMLVLVGDLSRCHAAIHR
jgi:hypothetical protein